MLSDACYIYHSEESEYSNCRYCNAPDWKDHENDCEWVLETRRINDRNEKSRKLLNSIITHGCKNIVWGSYRCYYCDIDLERKDAHKENCLFRRVCDLVKEYNNG